MPKLIPKVLHAIWLGTILSERGKENTLAWKKKNSNNPGYKDYEMTIWLDSSTFLSGDKQETQKLQQEYQAFKQWAKNNNIVLNDVNTSLLDDDPLIKDKAKLKREMKSLLYYQDEITNPGSNYAAASDLLRVEILYREGGVYFDVEDVYPGEVFLGDLYACDEEQILIHEERRGLNNDLLASMPQGKFISLLRDNIKTNYDNLYKQDKRYWYAHRYIYLASFRTYHADRYHSTMGISGPDVLRKMLKIPYNNLLFPQEKYKSAAHQALSWVHQFNDMNYQEFALCFRLNAVEYFNLFIENQLARVSKENKILLYRFQELINKSCTPVSMLHLLKKIEKQFKQKEIISLNAAADYILERFELTTANAEKFLLYCTYAKLPIKDLVSYFAFRYQFYDEKESFKNNLNHTQGMLNFFHNQLNLGFLTVIKLLLTTLHGDYVYIAQKETQLIAQVDKAYLENKAYLNYGAQNAQGLFKPLISSAEKLNSSPAQVIPDFF